jgi:phage tail-like protein
MAVAADRKDPYASYRFKVEIDGIQVSGFSEATGLAIETDVETFREGGVNAHETQIPGPTKFPSKLILKRGLADPDLWNWYQEIMNGKVKRHMLTIQLLDPANSEQARWHWVFRDACPVKWSGPEFRAGTAEIAFESIELIHRGIQSGGIVGGQKR